MGVRDSGRLKTLFWNSIMVLCTNVSLVWFIVQGIWCTTSSRDSCFRRDSGVFHRLGRPTNWLLYALPSDICNNSITNANGIVMYQYSGFLSEMKVMWSSGSRFHTYVISGVNWPIHLYFVTYIEKRPNPCNWGNIDLWSNDVQFLDLNKKASQSIQIKTS